jgi:hypothetical protein
VPLAHVKGKRLGGSPRDRALLTRRVAHLDDAQDLLVRILAGDQHERALSEEALARRLSDG